jgi:hypothetical protein
VVASSLKKRKKAVSAKPFQMVRYIVGLLIFFVWHCGLLTLLSLSLFSRRESIDKRDTSRPLCFWLTHFLKK